MKILCTADWHIGKKLESFSRLEEQIEILEQITQIAESEKVDAVIVAGDCFDNQTPTPEMAKLFVKTLARLSRGGECLVLVIAGNHDHPVFLSASEAFASQVGVVIVGLPLEIPSVEENNRTWKVIDIKPGMITINFKKRNKTIRFLLTPYANAQRLRKDLGTDDPDKKTWEYLCESFKQNISHEEDIINILVTHYYFQGESKAELYQDSAPQEDENERSIVGTIGQIPLESIPEGIDYLILGHIHTPYMLHSNRDIKAFYTGSPLFYSKKDNSSEKSVLILDLSKKRQEYRIPLIVKRKIKTIKFDNFDRIFDTLEEEKENYLILIWEGDRYFTTEEQQSLRNTHSYIVRIESQPKINRKDNVLENIKSVEEQTTEELFIEYFKSTNQDLSPPENLLQVFNECLNEESKSVILEKKRGFLPKSLNIKGFYSYKEETTIDFSPLEEKKLFGIFGNTGSGKSAIIEAMIIALFGGIERLSSSGNFSKYYSMMNLDSDELLIEFIFEIYEQDGTLIEYCCRISGKRQKNNFNKITSDRDVFVKDQDEWIPVEKKSGEELLGISYDDFRKTIILQQRDFLSFISSTPKETTDTLMRLFQLERFNLTDNVKKLEQKDSGDLTILQTQIKILAQNTPELLEELNAEITSLEEHITENKKILSGLHEERSKLKEKENRYTESLAVKEQFENLQQKEEEYSQAKERQALNTLIEINEKIENLNNQLTELKAHCKQLKHSEAEQQQKLETMEKDGTNIRTQHDNLKEEVEKQENLWKQLLQANLSTQLSELKHKKENYEKLTASVSDEDEKIEQAMEKTSDRDSIITILLNKQKEEEKIKDLLGLSILSVHLQDGCECPLCGSTKHPNPYQGQYNQDQLNQITQEIEKSQKQLNDITVHEKLLTEYQDNIAKYRKQQQKILDESSYASFDVLVKEFDQIEQQTTEWENKKSIVEKELEEKQKELEEKQKKLEESRKNYSTQDKLCDKISSDIENINRQIEEKQKELEEKQKEKAHVTKEKNITDEEYQLILSYPKKTDKDITDYFTEFNQLKGRYNALQGDSENNSIEQVKASLQDIDSQLKTLGEKQQEQNQKFGSLKTEYENTNKNIEEKNRLQIEYDTRSIRKENIDLLKNLFKGNGFVNFVGQKYLMKLCHTANQRFLNFTQNQFELSVPDEQDEKKGKIVIVDCLSGGNKRDLSTLSGGQSFQAALALALALADESGAGHRFFFVDEGFGSLDNDSLSIIMENLRELTEYENRIVGLISHVSLMKEEVPICLQVEFDKNKGTQISLMLN